MCKAGMQQGRTRLSYIRLPFLVDDPDQFDYLRLDMMYDDGFVAYLNGVKVAYANAPDTLAWNSKASAKDTPTARPRSISGVLSF